MSTFEKRVKSHTRKSKNIVKERQELVMEVFTHAEKTGDYDYAAVLLNGLWSAGCYSASKTIKEYLVAHAPFAITKKEGEPFTAKMKRGEDKKRAYDFTTPVVAYNEWEKEAIEKELTADKIIKMLDAAVKKSDEKLSDDEQALVMAHLKKLAA